MSPLEDAATPGRAGAARPGARERIATRLAFFIAGFAVSAWAPLIPFAKRRLALDDAQLGLMLLCLGIGSVLMMPLAGGLAARFGCRRTILAAGTVICLCLPALMLAPSIPVLAAALAVFGASLGVLDVVMNLQAVIVERASGRAMMSGFHGMYSVGGIAGAGGVAGALALGASPLVAITGTAVLAALLLAAAHGGLLAQGGEGDHPAFALPRGFLAFGEVGLAGEVRPAPRGQERLKEAAKLGFSVAVVPKANAPKKPIEGLTIHAVERVEEAMNVVRGIG